LMQDSRLQLLHKPSYSQFRAKIPQRIVTIATRINLSKNSDAIKSADRVNSHSGTTMRDINAIHR